MRMPDLHLPIQQVELRLCQTVLRQIMLRQQIIPVCQTTAHLRMQICLLIQRAILPTAETAKIIQKMTAARMIQNMTTVRKITVRNTKIPLELYVHIPFCVRKCQYCDFLSGPSDQKTRDAYVDALCREIRSISQKEAYEVVSVFIGGGTPSVLSGEQLCRIMDEIKQAFILSGDAEITMEANPGTVSPEQLKLCHEAGINRISFGLQSTVQQELDMLGRIHTYEEFLQSYHWARKAGFSNINVDLMFAIPGQTCENWKHNLETIAELSPEHISAYSLIIEEGTPFAQKKLILPTEDEEYQMYEDTAEILRKYGFYQYEISNYARDGFECRHNKGYWQRTEYLGAGLGAASLFRGKRFSNTRDMQTYLADSTEPEKIREDVTTLSRNNEIEEFMFLGLRMTEGISERQFERNFGCRIEDIYGSVLAKYKEMDLLEHTGEFWRFTRKGIHVSNPVLADFLLDE